MYEKQLPSIINSLHLLEMFPIYEASKYTLKNVLLNRDKCILLQQRSCELEETYSMNWYQS